MLRHLFEDLRIHGEGGDGAGAAPGAAPATEASGDKAPDAGEQKQWSQRATHAERRAAFRQQQEAEMAKQAQQQAQQPQDPRAQQQTGQKLYTQEEMEKAVTGRVKNLKDSSEENNMLKEEIERLKAETARRDRLLARLGKAQYDIEPGEDGVPDIDALEKEDHKALVRDNAYEHGTSEEYEEKRLKMENDLKEKDRQIKEYQALEEARKKDQLRAQMLQEHLRQAEEFRMEVPGFDLLDEAEKNPKFAKYLSFGFPVSEAYYAVHHRELMAAGQQAAAKYATRALSSSIQAGASMPVEGGLGRAPAASPERAVDVKANWRELKRRAQRGEKVCL